MREKEANNESGEVGEGQILKGMCTDYRVWIYAGCSGQPVKVLCLHQSFQILPNCQPYHAVQL